MYQRTTLELHSTAKDRIPADAPATVWNDARNVLFKDGESRRVPGDLPVSDVSDGISVTPRTMTYLRVGATPLLIVAGEEGIQATDGYNTYDLTPDYWFPEANSVWTSGTINGFAFVNCSTDEPVYWDGNTASYFDRMPDWPAGRYCTAMRAHKNFLFAIGMTDTNGTECLWSDSAEAGTFPQEWTADQSNDAGSVTLSPSSTSCLDGLTMGDEFVIYKEQSIWTGQFVGGTYIFTHRETKAEIGLASTNALCRGPNDEHLFVTNNGDVVLHGGGQVVSILEGRGLRDFHRAFDAENYTSFCCATHMREKTAYVVTPDPEGGPGNRALLFDFVSGDIGYRDMPPTYSILECQLVDEDSASNSWDGDAGAWDDDATIWNAISARGVDDILSGGTAGIYCHTVAAQDEFYTGPVSATLTKTGVALGNAQRKALVRRIWPKITGTTGDRLDFTLLAQDEANGPITRSETKPYYIGQSRWIDVFLQGRFLGMEIASAAGSVWRIGTVDVEFKQKGRF